MVRAHKFRRELVQRTAAESGLCGPLVLDYLPEMLNIISANSFLGQPSQSIALSSRCWVLHRLSRCLNKRDWLYKQRAERETVLQLSSEMDFQDTGPVVYHTLSSDIVFFTANVWLCNTDTRWRRWWTRTAYAVSKSWPSVLLVNCPLTAVNQPTLSTRI